MNTNFCKIGKDYILSTPAPINNKSPLIFDDKYINMLRNIITLNQTEIWNNLETEFYRLLKNLGHNKIKLKIDGWIDDGNIGTFTHISFIGPSQDGKYINNHIIFCVSTKPIGIYFVFMDNTPFLPSNYKNTDKLTRLKKSTLPLTIYKNGHIGVSSTNCEKLDKCLKFEREIKLNIMRNLCSSISNLILSKGKNILNQYKEMTIPNNIKTINNHAKVDSMINMNMRNIKNIEFGKESNYYNNNNPTANVMKFCGPNWFNFYVNAEKKEDYYIKIKSIKSANSYNTGYFRYVGPHKWEIKAENGINYDKCYHGPFYGPLWNGFYINDTNTNYYYPDRYGKYYKLNTINMGNKIALGPIDLDINKDTDLYIISKPNNGYYSWEYVYHTGYNNGKWLYKKFKEGKDYLKDTNNQVYFRVNITRLLPSTMNYLKREEKNFILYQDLEGYYYNFYQDLNKMKNSNKASDQYKIMKTSTQNRYEGVMVSADIDWHNKFSIAYNNCKGGTKNKKNNVDFKTYTVVELKHMCKYYNIKNYSKLNKSDLIKVLKKNLKTIL